MSSIKQCMRQVTIILPTTCRSGNLWKNYQSFARFTKIFVSFSLVMHSFDHINIQRLVVNTFFKNVSLCNQTFWSSLVGNVSFQIFQGIYEEKIRTECDFIPRGKDAINECIKGSNYLSIRYIHRYCTGPPRIASRGKWTARWTITSKNAGGKNLSSSHSIRTTRYSSFSNSLRFRVLEHKSWKKLPNSNNTILMSLSTNPYNPIGRIHCSSTWQSWLFKSDNLLFFALTDLDMLAA